MTLRSKARGQAYLRNRQSQFREEPNSPCDSHVENKTVRQHARADLEKPRELIWRKADNISQFGAGKLAIQISRMKSTTRRKRSADNLSVLVLVGIERVITIGAVGGNSLGNAAL